MGSPFVYVACAEEGTIDSFRLLYETGLFETIGRTPGVDVVRGMALNAEHGVLYAGMNTAEPLVRTFSIDRGTGSLTAVSDAPLPATNTYLGLAHDGTQVFVASYLNGVVSSIPVRAHGHLAEGAKIVGTPGPQSHCVASAPTGQYVYATSTGGDRLVWYVPEADGLLAEAGAAISPKGSGPRHFRFSPDGSKLYLVHEMSGVVKVFDRDAQTGQLLEIQSIQSVPEELGLTLGTLHTSASAPLAPSASPIWCADVQVAGNFLFTTERTSSTISTFAIDPATGLLTYLRSTATETQPRGTAVTQSLEFLLVCGEKSAAMSAYRIHPGSGELELTDRVNTAGVHFGSNATSLTNEVASLAIGARDATR